MPGRILLVLTLGVLGLGTLTSTAAAATPSTVFQPFATPNPEPQPGGRWGERLVAANDLNGDGVKDIFTATPSADGQYVDQGRVYLLSGKDRSILRTIDSPEPQGGTNFGFTATRGAKFGFYISVPGDLNGDGKDDVVVGTDQQNVYTGSKNGVPNTAPCGAAEPNGCNEGQGKAWAFSGATSRVLHVFDNPDPQGAPGNNARFGSRIGRAGDVTADGVPDIIIGASNNDVPAGCGDEAVAAGCFKNQGQSYIFNGATGALVRTLNLPVADQQGASCSSNCGTFGLSVQGPGDTSGDGVPDQLVDAANYTPAGSPAGVGRMYLFDGSSGAVLLRIDDPDPQAGATFGFQDAAPNSPGDVNGDGTPDLYAHGFGQDGPTGLVDQGRAWVFNGRTGALIHTIDDPTPTAGGTFGFSLSRTDYNKDATPDLYIGQAPHGGGDENGGTYVFDGRDASLLKALELPEGDRQIDPGDGGPSLGFGAAAPGDLNGDGEADYLGGAPFFNENGVQDAGRI
nr:FG-GAP repeat protein [Solirubrobacterales bacterium]